MVGEGGTVLDATLRQSKRVALLAYLAVDATRVRCDVREFDTAIETARYADAIAVYRGPFLDGVHVEGAGEEAEDWIPRAMPCSYSAASLTSSES